MKRSLLLFAIVVSPTSCRDSVSPSAVSLTTDKATYVAELGSPLAATREHSFRLIARFTNQSDQTVSLSRCFHDTPYPIYGIATFDSDTVAAYDPGWGCVGGHFFHVAAGATRVDTLPVRAPWGISGSTGQALGVFEGRFVLVYQLYYCAESTSPCGVPPYATVQSAVFRVVRPQ